MAAALGIAILVVIVLLWRRAAGTPESVSGGMSYCSYVMATKRKWSV